MLDFMVWLQNFRTPFLNKLVELITISAEEYVLIAALCIFLWVINKEYGYRLGLAIILSSVTNAAIKLSFKTPRPWTLDERIVPIRQETATGYSFPSGHTQGGATLWFSLFDKYEKKWLRALSVIMIVLIAFSRVYLSVHTPADVAAAIGLAILITYFSNWVMDRVTEKRETFWLPLLAFIAIVGLLIFPDASYVKMAGLLVSLPLAYYLETKYIRFTTQADWWKQILKVILGLAVTLLFKEGLKFIFPDQLFFHFLRYFFTGLAGIVAAPWLFVKLNLAKQTKKRD
jgi:membrane-associated phospholipid phosphatase